MAEPSSECKATWVYYYHPTGWLIPAFAHRTKNVKPDRQVEKITKGKEKSSKEMLYNTPS